MQQRKLLFLFILLGVLSINSFAQSTCDNGRYINRNYFASVKSDTGIIYGSNKSAGDTTVIQTLKMDVYQPVGDTLKERPVIIFAFGGSFIAGSRGDMASLCTSFAKMGYVTVAPDYRYALGAIFPPNQVNVTLEVLRAAHDLKAVIRYFRKNVTVDTNTYKVDTSAIIVGGVSAGAIAALHAAYLDSNNQVPPYIVADTAGLGGIEGLSGNQGYPSSVSGCISFSGTIGDTLWIKRGSAPLVMVHDTTDPTVPFGTAQVYVSGFATGLIASGDGDINTYLNRIGGVPHKLYSYNHGWHVDYLSQDYDSVVARVSRFLVQNDNVCKSLATGINELTSLATGFNVYPNPSQGLINISNRNNQAYNVEVFNTIGQSILLQNNIVANNNSLNLSGKPQGMYILMITNAADHSIIKTEKLIVE